MSKKEIALLSGKTRFVEGVGSVLNGVPFSVDQDLAEKLIKTTLYEEVSVQKPKARKVNENENS